MVSHPHYITISCKSFFLDNDSITSIYFSQIIILLFLTPFLFVCIPPTESQHGVLAHRLDGVSNTVCVATIAPRDAAYRETMKRSEALLAKIAKLEKFAEN